MLIRAPSKQTDMIITMIIIIIHVRQLMLWVPLFGQLHLHGVKTEAAEFQNSMGKVAAYRFFFLDLFKDIFMNNSDFISAHILETLGTIVHA